MAQDEEKRVKMCRYCDGLIEFGTKVCPHCEMDLEVVKFDDLDFVRSDVPRGVSEMSPPVVAPIQPDSPPVVRPLSPRSPPVLKPMAPGRPPVAKPLPGKGPPVRRPVKRARKKPPIVKPIDEPPIVAPIPDDLPDGVMEVAECPICGADTTRPESVGGNCRHCDAIVCLPCLMRANGVRAGRDPSANRDEWEGFLSLGARTIRCPACGRPEIA